MIDGKFDLVFRGQTVKNVELSEVKANLVSLFKSSPDAIEKLFTGGEVTVRKALDYSTAMKYQSALKKAGALALIKEIEGQSATESVNAAANTDQTGETQPQSSNEQISKPSETETNLATDGESDSFTVAAPGTQILPDKVYEKRDVDTSDLSLAAAGERILPKTENKVPPPPSTEHLSLE